MIATAARLPGIAAAVAQCPFTDGIASARTLSPLITLRVTMLAIRDLVAARLGKPPVMIATAGSPGEVALMNTPDAYPGYLRLVPEGVEVPNEMAARIAMKVITYRPGRFAQDRLPDPVLRVRSRLGGARGGDAALRGQGSARRGQAYPEGHFAIYVDEAFERVVADQIAFLDKHLKGAGA